MTRRVLRGSSALVLLSLLALIPGARASEAISPPPIDREVSKQTSIYESRGEDVPRGYVIDRSLLSYMFVLPAEFKHSLANLGPRDRWLDIGAGEGRAVLDYTTGKYDAMLQGQGTGKARAVAMSIEDRRTAHWGEAASAVGPDQIKYLVGRRFRDYSLAELGSFRIITDVVGAFSYTRFPSRFMQHALDSLQVNGTLYTLLQDVLTASGANRPYYADAPFLTELRAADGSELKVCSWLQSIGCVEVTCEAKPQFPPPIEVYRIRKVCESVSVPRLELVHFQSGTPPERRFQLLKP